MPEVKQDVLTLAAGFCQRFNIDFVVCVCLHRAVIRSNPQVIAGVFTHELQLPIVDAIDELVTGFILLLPE